MALNIGDRLGHDDVTALIGEGGMRPNSATRYSLRSSVGQCANRNCGKELHVPLGFDEQVMPAGPCPKSG